MPSQPKPVNRLRTALFVFSVPAFTVLYTLFSIAFVRLIPYQKRFAYLTIWSRMVIWLAKTCCGIRYQFHGMDKLPKDQPYVVIAKHQSQWETFHLVNVLQPISIVCKKELLKTPLGIGYGISLLQPIAINRDDPRKALKDIQNQGLARLRDDNMPVLIFPEGTRTPVDSKGKYARSGAALAIAAGVPVIFATHNAGYFWPSRGFDKFAGTIDVHFSEPVSSHDKTALQLTREAEEWIESHLPTPRYR
ncbi:Uncharacterised protein [BD1-7 clade bacterium]|uniref:Phospholipid/glycerol acyltransferase domain-containing protein n=1 Tax=BD1-7 clade bacterium TaxID=2029982 RepID=A0A5S9Q9N4_9GAMM|nr:Uncharacterised protein [BD1-7 clade bacterium]CAA0115106.1 Uncharacterised protein [BD1-7 clade bacterium]